MSGYPIELDLRGRTVLVVGLGRVGTRKASGLVEAGARVVGIDPGQGVVAPAGVEHRAEAFRPEHLEGMSLVFAAATPEVNRLVVAEAKRAGVWVNAASEPTEGDFTVPAIWRSGLVTLTVSTSGASPALARILRDRAARAIEDVSPLAALLAELRPLTIDCVHDIEVRSRLFRDWGDPKWLDVVAVDGPEAVRAEWLRMLSVVSQGSKLSSPEGNTEP